MKEKVTNRLKYPEYLRIRAKLQTNDKAKIAETTGYREGTIREMLNGYRLMPDAVKLAIIQLLRERWEIDKAMEEIANQ